MFGIKGHILFGEHLTFGELTRRFDAGAQLVQVSAGDGSGGMHAPSDHLTLLFAVSPRGDLHVVTATAGRGLQPADKTIWLVSSQAQSAAPLVEGAQPGAQTAEPSGTLPVTTVP